MGKDRSSWRDGRRAWERLTGWQRDKPPPGDSDDGESALDALADVGLVRRLLDQTELVAVRTARRHGKSWAEIATRLGVTRQSAWERWRDLDETRDDVRAESRDEASDRPHAEPPPQDAVQAEVAGRAARRLAGQLRRRSSVDVPNVVGMSWHDARDAVGRAGLVAIAPNPSSSPDLLGWADDAVVTDQSPESGARVLRGAVVTLWAERGGGSGVREPRHPRPISGIGRAMQDEPSHEAAG